MTGKVLENKTAGVLVLIIPVAISIVFIYTAWPVILAIIALSIIFKVWQKYQWQRWSRKINPFFNELIKENQGCVTAMDLSLKANMSAKSAQRFLAKKAEEYGAQRKDFLEKGTVYYFLTASALGSIFVDSEPVWEVDEELDQDSLSKTPVATEVAPEKITKTATATLNPQTKPALAPMIQGELAKRFNVHTATVGKKKNSPKFPQWSKNKDPEGIAWRYSKRKKLFEPLDS